VVGSIAAIAPVIDDKRIGIVIIRIAGVDLAIAGIASL
jgi:hypothetical protein